MKKTDLLVKNICIILGFASIAFFVVDIFVFSILQPKMVNFEFVPPDQEGLLSWIGVGLLLLLVFCLFSLFRLVKFIKTTEKIERSYLLLVISGILSFLFIFGDVALLSDIVKQYKHSLAQPEWSLLYLIMVFQFVSTTVITCFHLFGFREDGKNSQVVRDNNIFLIVQYVGMICGLLGLIFSSLGFIFPRGWSLLTHTVLSSIILFTPYVLALGYWIITKFKEKNRQWYDEKQRQDIGKSAFITLLLCVILMTGFFIANYNNLAGVISILWLPLFLYSVLFLYSTGNFYFYGKE